MGFLYFDTKKRAKTNSNFFLQLLLNIIQGLVYRDFRDVIQSIDYEKLYTSAVVVLLGELDVSGKIFLLYSLYLWYPGFGFMIPCHSPSMTSDYFWASGPLGTKL
jgi:hypothetical protein